MSLLGRAAMLLSFDVLEAAVAEHDRWHTVEHLPERLSIPGFLRGSRWIASDAGPRYFVMYEVAELATLQSPPYRERLDHPSPWTARMMTHYRGMARGFCNVVASAGTGLGSAALIVRFSAAPATGGATRDGIVDELGRLASREGLGSAHLFERASTPEMTAEQRIRGADADVDGALLATGYDSGAVESLMREGAIADALAAVGARVASAATYRLHYTLTDRELQR